MYNDKHNFESTSLTILKKLISSCNNISSLDELYDCLTDLIIQRFTFENIGIYSFDEAKRQLILINENEYSEQFSKKLPVIDTNISPFDEILSNKKLLFLEDIAHYHIFENMKLSSLAVVPIYDEALFSSIIILGSKAQHKFQANERALLEIIFDAFRVMVKKMFIIDKLKNKESSLKHSKQLYKSVLENANDVIYILENHKFSFVNKRFEEVFGFTSEEICNSKMGPFEITAPESYDLIKSRAKARKDGKTIPSRYEFKALTKSKKVIDVEVNTVNIGAKGEIRVVGILRDITEKKQLEMQIRHAEKMDSIGQLAGGIAHDFNNLLTGIIGNLDLLEMDLSDNSLEIDLVTEAKKAAERAANLTNQLLAFSQRTKSDLQSVNLNSVVIQTRDFLKEIIDPRVNISLDLDEDLCDVNGDQSDLYRMILNLCINSCDAIIAIFKDKDFNYSKKLYTINIETKNIYINKEVPDNNHNIEPGYYILIKVSDNGIGIDKEVRDKIFEPFFTTKEVGEGTGLGLSAVYGIVEKHNGWIEVDSKLKSGTCFKIYLPRREMITESTKQQTMLSNLSGNAETILIVDDEEVIRNLGQRLLERKGYKVLIAKDGLEAINIYKKKQELIDLIILDLTMPKLSGKDVILKMLALNSDAKVILTSGFSTTIESQDDLKQLGAIDFIPKPYQFPDLLKRIKIALNS